jgi:hypothetical protein
MAIEELLQHAPPEAIYHRAELPDEQNALGPWREAIEHYVSPSEDDSLWGDLVYGAGEEGTPIPFPGGPESTNLQARM